MARDTRTEKSPESASTGQALVSFIKVRNIRVLLVAALLTFAISHGFTNWLPKMLENGGMSSSTAGLAASVSVFAGIPAVLIIPRVVPLHSRGRAVALLALLTAGALMLSLATSFPMLVGLVLFGIASFSLFPLLMLILMETPEVGPGYMGLAGGIFFAVAEIGGFTGPLFMGALFDFTGGFVAGVSFLAVLSLSIFVLMFSLRTPASGI